MPRSPLIALLVAGLAPALAVAQVASVRRVSEGAGGFGGDLREGDAFGVSLANLGDLDGDGAVDLAVGASLDDDGGPDRGAVWILFLNRDGTVRDERKVSALEGGFTGELDDGDRFGNSVAALGDVDGDGVTDLAVGAPLDDDGDILCWNIVDRGAVWILFLHSDGTVKGHQKLSATAGGFTGNQLTCGGDNLGFSVAPLGDHDGDGVPDLAVGMPGYTWTVPTSSGWTSPAGFYPWGSVFLVHLRSDGTVKDELEITRDQGVTDPWNSPHAAAFGSSVANLGDLDGNGTTDLAVGASLYNPIKLVWGGAFWILLMNENGTVGSQVFHLGAFEPFHAASLESFALALHAPGDLDDDGVSELLVGIPNGWSVPGPNTGQVLLVKLTPSGDYASHVVLGTGLGGMPDVLEVGDRFGRAITSLGDLNGDGRTDLIVGAATDDTSEGVDVGSFYELFLECSFPAGVVDRPGSGVNPDVLSSISPPLAGSTWLAHVDPTGTGALGSLLAFSLGGPLPSGVTLSGPLHGELLARPPFLRPFSLAHDGVHAIPLPSDCGYLGRTYTVLGLFLGPGPSATLTNALDVTLGTF